MSVAVTTVGFFGKLPSRGDFVRAGLPRSFTDPWDAWLREVLPASRAVLGERWIPAWLEAPVWRFVLPPGICGPVGVRGLWMPSVDCAGRYFPLVLAWVGGDGAVLDEDFLAAAEGAGRAAIGDDWSPDELAGRVGRLEGDGVERAVESPTSPSLSAPRGGEGQVGMRGCETLWWTEGAPRRPGGTLISVGLPDGVGFARMLDEQGTDRT